MLFPMQLTADKEEKISERDTENIDYIGVVKLF